MDTEEPVKIQPPPRRFVEVLRGGGLFGSIVSAIYPVLRFLVPPPVVDLGGDEIVVGKVGDLKPNGSKIVRFGTRPALLLMTAEGEYRTLSSNHGTVHPTEPKLDAGPEAVCVQGHKPGDICDQQRAAMRSGLEKLDDAVEAAEKVLVAAEPSGLEVSQARLDQDQARDALTKARVTIHSFKPELVEQDVQEGVKIAAKNLQAAQARSRNAIVAAKGSVFALVFILITVLGLFLYLRQIESPAGNA